MAKDRTAMSIETPAPGLLWLEKHHYLKSEGVKTILDYGAGHGRNANYLRSQGFEVYAYDPCHYNEDGCWYGVSNQKPPEHLYFDLVLTSYVLNVMTEQKQNELLAYLNHFADKAIHIVRYKDLLEQLRGTKVKYIDYWKHHNIPNLSLEDKAKYGFTTSRGFQRLVDIDGYTTSEFHINLIKDGNNYRMYEQIAHKRIYDLD